MKWSQRPEVVEHCNATRPSWQTRIDPALRAAILKRADELAHKAHRG